RLYGTRKKIVPITKAASTRPDTSRYADAKGNAVLIQLSGREAARSSPIIVPPQPGPEHRQQDDGGQRVGEVLDGGEADARPEQVRVGVGEQARGDHDGVE